MILNACVRDQKMVDENICKNCSNESCRHAGEMTVRERLDADTAPLLNELFWDCECDNRFVQPKSVVRCPRCGACQEDMPDSRQNEIDAGIYFAE